MIYFVQREDTGLIKIGYSHDVEKRMKQIKMHVPLLLLGVCIGSRQYEEQLHQRFWKYRYRQGVPLSEWFNPGKPILDFIAHYTVRWGIVIPAVISFEIHPPRQYGGLRALYTPRCQVSDLLEYRESANKEVANEPVIVSN